MPSTYSSLAYHLVFGTKQRRRLLKAEIRPRVYEYLGGIVRSEGGSLTEIGGVEDHVHLLLRLTPSHRLADFVRVLKANSSKWINEESLTSERFAWQDGYGVFTVSESQIETVRRYLQRQEEHHAELGFLEEPVSRGLHPRLRAVALRAVARGVRLEDGRMTSRRRPQLHSSTV